MAERRRLEKGSVWVMKGRCEFRLASGRAACIGRDLAPGESVVIPTGKRVPLEVQEASEAEFAFLDGGGLDLAPGRTIPAQWDDLVEEVYRTKSRTVLVLGEVDTGKTFFSTYLANRLLAKGLRVGILDADTGQSDIGPPGTLGLAILKSPTVFLTEVEPEAIYFTGAHSPALHFLPVIVGLARLVAKGLEKSDVLIVDTPGWVQGDGGRALRQAEMDLLRPDKIVLMQRAGELEHLVKAQPASRVARLLVSRQASPTSPAERKKLREALTIRYYRDARPMRFSFSEIATDRCYFLTGTRLEVREVPALWAEKLSGWEGILVVTETRLSPEQVALLKKTYSVDRVKNILAGVEAGVEVGLLDENQECLALGIVKKIDYPERRIYLHTPLPASARARVRVLQFGSLRLNLDGSEAGFIEPGTL